MPYGIAINETTGDLFILNNGNNTVVVVPGPTTTHVFGQTVTAGTPAVLLPSTLSALVNNPGAIAVDAQGDLFIGNDGNSTVTVVPSPSTTTVFGQSVTADTPVALTALAGISGPMGFAFDSAGDLFVASESSGTITVLPASTTTVFGQSVTADTAATLDPGTSGSLAALTSSGSMGLGFDSAGDLFVEDNSGSLTVVPATGTTSIYGQNVTADAPVDLLTSTLTPLLSDPMGLFIDASGNLLISNYGGSNVIAVPWGAPALAGPLTFSSGAFPSVTPGQTSSLTVTVTNTGTASLTPSSINASGTGVSVSGGTCSDGTAIASTTSCTVILSWNPSSAGALSSAALAIDYPGGANPSDSLSLSGTAVNLSSPTSVAPVTNLSASLASGTLSATWTASSTASSYTCTLLDGTNSPTSSVVTTSTTSCSFSGLSGTDTFGVSVVATNGSASSTAVVAYAATSTTTTTTTTPPAPPKKSPAPLELRVYFANSSTGLTSTTRATLAAFAAKVDRLHSEHVAIAGYTDSSGDRALNLALSLQRGRSVSQFLATRFAELHVSISLSVRGGGVTHVSTSAARDRVVVVTT